MGCRMGLGEGKEGRDTINCAVREMDVMLKE
jgi:hypothetical protein